MNRERAESVREHWERVQREVDSRLEAEADAWLVNLHDSLAFMRRCLDAFWRYHRAGETLLAAKLLDLLADEECDSHGDCPVMAELSSKLGYDEYDEEARIERKPTESRAERRAELTAICAAHPL